MCDALYLLDFSTAKKPKGTPPEFLKPLKKVVVVEGSAAKLECRIHAKPEPVIEWLKDDEPVKPDNRIKTYFDSEVCRLTISDTVADDEGEYKCSATNELGSASCSAELLVNEVIVMPEFKEKMKHAEVVEGDTVRFNVCVVGNPQPKIEWSKGGKTINHGGRFRIEQSDDLHSLFIDNASMDDFGSYKCVATNEAGRMQCSARLDIREREIAPELSDEYGDLPIDVTEGDELKINITIQGNPRPDVEWYKDDRPLRRTSRVSLSARGIKHAVTILNVVPDDSGVYRCVGKNSAGTTSRTFQVNVKGTLILLSLLLLLLLKKDRVKTKRNVSSGCLPSVAQKRLYLVFLFQAINNP